MYVYVELKFANSNKFSFPLASVYRISTANISNIRYLEQILMSFWSSSERSWTVLPVKDFLKTKDWRELEMEAFLLKNDKLWATICLPLQHFSISSWFYQLLHYIVQPFPKCAPYFAYDLVEPDIAECSDYGCTRNFQTRAFYSKQGTEIWPAGY